MWNCFIWTRLAKIANSWSCLLVRQRPTFLRLCFSLGAVSLHLLLTKIHSVGTCSNFPYVFSAYSISSSLSFCHNRSSTRLLSILSHLLCDAVHEWHQSQVRTKYAARWVPLGIMHKLGANTRRENLSYMRIFSDWGRIFLSHERSSIVGI